MVWCGCGVVAGGCGVYSFTGVALPTQITTVYIPTVRVETPVAPPTLSSALAEALTRQFLNYSRLSPVNKPDSSSIEVALRVTDYRVDPIAPTSDYATRSRLTISVTARYKNHYDQTGWERPFTRYVDFDANTNPSQIESTYMPQVVEQLATDIFNTVANQW